MAGTAMSKREKQIFDFITAYRSSNGLSPSMQEIADGVGLYSTSSVHRHIHSMIDKGWLMPFDGRKRGLVPSDGKTEVNCVGR